MIAQLVEILIWYLFAPEYNKKKSTPKVGYFSKTAEIFSTAMLAKSAPKQGGNKVHLTFSSTWDI